MFEFLLISVDLFLGVSGRREWRDYDAGVKLDEYVSKPFKVLGLPLDLPADSDGPVFVACNRFYGEEEFCLFDEFVDEIGVLVVDFFNTILKKELT